MRVYSPILHKIKQQQYVFLKKQCAVSGIRDLRSDPDLSLILGY